MRFDRFNTAKANAAIFLDVNQGCHLSAGDLAGMVVRSPASEHLGTTRPCGVAQGCGYPRMLAAGMHSIRGSKLVKPSGNPITKPDYTRRKSDPWQMTSALTVFLLKRFLTKAH
jgi:hypothetical protein